MSKIKMLSKHNPIAKDLRTPKYKKRIIAARKGAGSYKRNRRTDSRCGDFYFLPCFPTVLYSKNSVGKTVGKQL